MRVTTATFIFILLLSVNALGQELTREQKLQKTEELNNQIKILEEEILKPDAKDLQQAEKEGFQVFRLMPRERYDRKFSVQGGGAYYSFTTKSNDYQKTAQIQLEQKFLSVGFAGADYGFIADLGNIPLAGVNKENNEINFLVNYKPPTNEPEVRSEQRKSHEYETENATYRSRVTANIGHSYALRAINFDRADILVAFKIHRKDADGSLIIFWKTLETFEVPKFTRKEQDVSINGINFTTMSPLPDLIKVNDALTNKGFNSVTVSEENRKIVLRGKVPKGRLAEVIAFAQETIGKPVRNELTEQ